MVFLAENCDNDDYKNVLLAMANSYKVPVIDIPTWIELKDACKLGLDSKEIVRIAESKGKEAKIKPRCSCAGIVEWGEESLAKEFLIKLAENQ
jgi:ribosomal protein L7Ae-like RNA K-turn-binding protein